jgi:hypothetical protein
MPVRDIEIGLDSVDPGVFLVMLVVGYLIPDIQKDKDECGKTDRKPQDIQESIELIPEQITKSRYKEVPEHNSNR